MPIQSGVYKPLPSVEVLQEIVEEENRHYADLTSYLWYIMPMAEVFGDSVYQLAARSLREESGIAVSSSELKELAEELQTPDGLKKYARERHLHVFRHVTG
jgi:hypothetical protein